MYVFISILCLIISVIISIAFQHSYIRQNYVNRLHESTQ